VVIISDDYENPVHYTKFPIECVDYIRAQLSTEELRGFYRGNLLKYVSRYREKAGVKDLKKAQVFLKWLIELEEREEKARYTPGVR